jgi:hypothetical protein
LKAGVEVRVGGVVLLRPDGEGGGVDTEVAIVKRKRRRRLVGPRSKELARYSLLHELVDGSGTDQPEQLVEHRSGRRRLGIGFCRHVDKGDGRSRVGRDLSDAKARRSGRTARLRLGADRHGKPQGVALASRTDEIELFLIIGLQIERWVLL